MDGLGATDMPVFDAQDPQDQMAEPAVERGGARLPASRRGPGRAAAAAGVALILLVAGIGLGGGQPRSSIQPDGPSGSTVVADLVTGTAPCQPPRTSAFPAILLESSGSRRTTDGDLGYAVTPDARTELPDWQVPPVTRGLAVGPNDSLTIAAGVGTCLRHVIAEYSPTDLMPATRRVGMFSESVTPPARRVQIGSLPEGDWVVRVTASFETLSLAAEYQVVTVTYFRVLSGRPAVGSDPPIASPDVEPAVTPAVPCGAGPVDLAIVVDLTVGSGQAIPGARGPFPDDFAPPGDVPAILAPLGEAIVISSDGNPCAVGWSFESLDPESRARWTMDGWDAATAGGTLATQDRWQIQPELGTRLLLATLQFPGGIEVVRAWRVTVDPFSIPEAFLVGPDGTRTAAGAGCGLSMNLANGYSAADSCGGIGYPLGLDTLHVMAWQPVRFEIPGWDILSWYAACGKVVSIAGDPDSFDGQGCELGGATSDDGGPLADPVSFVLPPGPTVVQISVSAIRNGDRFWVSFYAPVVAE